MQPPPPHIHIMPSGLGEYSKHLTDDKLELIPQKRESYLLGFLARFRS